MGLRIAYGYGWQDLAGYCLAVPGISSEFFSLQRTKNVFGPHSVDAFCILNIDMKKLALKIQLIGNVASAQRDGRPAEYTWRPLFNAAKFG